MTSGSRRTFNPAMQRHAEFMSLDYETYRLVCMKEAQCGDAEWCGEYSQCQSLSEVLVLAQVELGLRWLHDRAFDISLDEFENIWARDLVAACLGNLELGLRWLHDRANDLHCTVGCMLETGDPTCCHYKPE